LQRTKSVEHSSYQFVGVQNGYGNENVSFVCINIIAITDNSMMVLQDSLDSQKDVSGSHSEACSSLSLSGLQADNIKVEEFSDIEDSNDPVPITVVGIKVEHEVSCMFPLCPL
jgi:hypothetical protein